VSGPLLDRIDLHVAVPAVSWQELGKRPSEPSAALRERVARARERAGSRRPGAAGFRNADLSPAEIDPAVWLEPAARKLIETAVERLSLSVRAIHRCLRVARTIADLAEAERIAAAHLAEAISYRRRLSDDGPSPSSHARRLTSHGFRE